MDCLEALFGGSAGSGKSETLLSAALQYIDVPGYNAVLIRDSYQNLSKPDALIDRSFKWLYNTDAHWDGDTRTWKFPSGSTLSFGHMDGAKAHFSYQCVTPDHEVLTDNGWKWIKDVKEGELIATLNPNTREMIFDKVQKTFEYDYDDKMIKTYDRGFVSFCITPNHTVWLSMRKNNNLKPCKADSLPSVFCIPQWAKWNGYCDDKFIFTSDGHNGKSIEFNKEDYAEFLGWYLSEGSLDTSDSKRWGINISQNKGNNYNSICELLIRNGINVWKRERTISFCNKSLYLFLEKECGRGCRNKKILKKYKNWPVSMLRKLLYSLLQGDGHWYRKGRGIFVSSSKQLAEDVYEIALKCGFRVIIHEYMHDPNQSFPTKDGRGWRVYVSDMKERDTLVGNAKHTKPYQIDYKGKVFCVSVPSSVFLIRHNGKCSWTGNSSQYQFVGIDEVVAIPENQAIYLLSRLRRLEVNKHIPIRFRCASNPPTREQLSTGSWVKTRYIDPKTRKAGAVFIPAWMDDNPYLDKEEYKKSLANLDPITRAQLEKGDWEISARGRLFERQWFPLVNRVKDVVKKRIRYWDLAATEISKKNKDPDYTSGTLMCITDKNEYFIEHITRFREKPATVEANILKWANLDGRDTCIWIEQEPGSSGKSVIDHYVRDVLPGFIIKGQQARENKITRSELLASKAEQGLVYMVKGKWNDEFLDELDVFPDGLHEDQVDSTSGAFSKLSNKSSVKIAFFG